MAENSGIMYTKTTLADHTNKCMDVTSSTDRSKYRTG